jgi:hypothetical protein
MKFNGNISLLSNGLGEIQNIHIERVASNPTVESATQNKGRVVYNTTTNVLYLWNGTEWTALATGGDATALQTELNNLETALGSMINGVDGTFVASAFSGFANVTAPTSVLNVLSQIDSAIESKDALSELNDVAFTSPAAGDLLQFDGTHWVDHAIGTESGVQAYDAGLAALAAFNTNGFIVQTADNTFAGRTLTASATPSEEGIVITNGNGSATPFIGLDIEGLTAVTSAAASNVFPVFNGTNNRKIALSDLANSIGAELTINELSDVVITAATSGHILYFNGANWVNNTPTAAGVQPHDAGLDALAAAGSGLVSMDGDNAFFRTLIGPAAGITVSNGGGVAGNPTLALSDDLAAVEGLTGTGFAARTATNAWANRTLIAPSEGLTIANPAGIAGNPTFALANDLAALEGLTTTGYIVRTADGAATTRTIQGAAGNISIANGSGVSTDTTIDLADVTQGASGSFLKVTIDNKGRVTGNTAVVAADITALVDSTYVNVSGDTMTGNLNMGGSNKVTGLSAPTSDTDAATKGYVDSLVAGLSWKQAVRVATTGPLTLATDFEAGDIVDGVTLVAGDRILIKDQATQSQNGIYVVQASGAPVRATDLDVAAEFTGATVFVTEGTLNKDTGWTQTTEVVTLGTDNIVWNQFSAGTLYTWGTGLSITGNQVDVNLGAGIKQLPTDEVGIDLYTPTTGAIILTENGTDRSTGADAQLHLLLASGSGLAQSAAGLTISANGVTNAMIVNDTWQLNGDSGSSLFHLGDVFEIKGDSVQGIVTSVDSDNVSPATFTITATNASTSQKGVASFDSGDFAVAAGAVSIKAGGVDNSQLANSSITIAGSSGSDPVALGETLTFLGATTPITVAVTSNTATIAVADATTTTLGLASFSAGDFNVTGGAVSIKAGGVDNSQLANSTVTIAGDSGAPDAVALGETITFTGTDPIDTAITDNVVTISAKLASTSVIGVASFNSSHFSVTAGAVSLAATLSDLTDVDTSTDSPATDSILAYTGSTWAAVDPSTVLDSAVLDDLSDVVISTPADNQALIYNGTNWVNQKVYHLHTQAVAAASWVVTHNIGQKFCNVTVVDDTDEVIIPQSIKFDSATQLTVTFNSAVAGAVVVMGIA